MNSVAILPPDKTIEERVPPPRPPKPPLSRLPPLNSGDRLSRSEFERMSITYSNRMKRAFYAAASFQDYGLIPTCLGTATWLVCSISSKRALTRRNIRPLWLACSR